MATLPFFDKNKKYLIAIFPTLVLLLFIFYFNEITVYFLIAWLISMIGTPLNTFLRRFFGKGLAAAATLIVLMIITAFIAWMIIPPLASQTKNLSNINYEQLLEGLQEPIEDVNRWLEKYQLELTPEDLTPESLSNKDKTHHTETTLQLLDSIKYYSADSTVQHIQPINLIIHVDNENLIDNIKNEELAETMSLMDRLKLSVRKYVNPAYISSVFGSVVNYFSNFLIGLMSVLFISFFFLKESNLIDTIVKGLAPARSEGRYVQAVDDISSLLKRYFIGIIIQISIFSILISSGMKIFGLKNSVLIGLIAALLNVIPYLGPLLGYILAAIITISTYYTLPFYAELLPILIKVGILFAVVQMIDNFIVQPIVFGKSVKAHPLEIFVVVLMGAKLGGVMGMVLAIPGYTIFRVIAKVFMSEFKIIQQLTRTL